MENKYTEKTANVLLHLHPASHAHHHPEPNPNPVGRCNECQAGADDIVGNELPRHHPEYTCRCLKCGHQWMPNLEE